MKPLLSILFGLLSLAASAIGSQVVVLDDFETGAVKAWQGAIQISSDRASHGSQAGKITLQRGAPEVSLAPSHRDWKAFDRLLFDVYTDGEGVRTLSLRIYEDRSQDTATAGQDDYFDARGKIVLLNGWNHVEVNLHSLMAASFQREISRERIAKITLYAERTRLPWTLYIDNFRLVQGAEEGATASRTQPQDTVTIVENRFYTVRQVARAEDVPESEQVRRLRAEALKELESLKEAIRAAQLQGIDTIYQERYLVTADLGLRVRPRLAWYNNDRMKSELFTYVAKSCRQGRQELDDFVGGIFRLPETDDTQVAESLVPAYPPLKGTSSKGWFYTNRNGAPMFVISLHSPSTLLQRFFATPLQHIESYSVGGGSRWTIDESPVYEAFHKYSDARRVGWDGWCGHLVKDLDSMGGSKMENVVICLESPHTREAVDEYIRRNIPKLHANPQLLYNILAYELMYICYCERSQSAFREYLQKKHGTIANANAIFGASYNGFNDVVAPPVKNSRPLPGTNRALWYDWARFNMDRFTDYLLWVKSRVRAVDPSVPLAAGGSSSMLAGRTGTTGIDEERIVNEVDDLIIHEGAGSTMGMDLQLALSETPKPLADPEMSLHSASDLLPHALHGKSVMQFYHWPAQPPNEFLSNVNSSLPHSWRHSLADIGELIRSTLDVRRLSREIAAFVDAPAEVAILYSQTATLQLPPEMLTWQTTPYLAELENTYQASQHLDARVTFVTERQIGKGWLNRYKLLLVPAARNLPAEVVNRIWDYADHGGRVLVVPESFLGDEYNHPKDFLARLGVVVSETHWPKPGGSGAMVQGYDQSFSQEVTFAESSFPMKPSDNAFSRSLGELEGRGVKQSLKTGAAAETLFRFADGSPALLRAPLGKGVVYCAASSLETRSYARLLEALFEEAAVTRTVRVHPVHSADKRNIEARFARSGNRRFLYVVNFDNTPARLRVQAPPAFFSTLQDLRERRQIIGGEITVPAQQTAIYEVF